MANIQTFRLTVSLDLDVNVWELNYGTKDGIVGDLTETVLELVKEYIQTSGNQADVLVYGQ